MTPPINEFYRVVDKKGRVQVMGTFDYCFKELVELTSKLPEWGWHMEHIKDGKILYE